MMEQCIDGLLGCYDGLMGVASGVDPGRRRSTRKGAAPSTEKEFRRRIDFLSQVPLFRRMPRAQYPIVARVLHARAWKAGETVIEGGRPVKEFTLIAEGKAEVHVDAGNDHGMEALVPGDYFGEKLLEQGSARLSLVSIVAGEGLVTLSMAAAEFEELGLRKHLCFPRRKAMGRHVELRSGSSSELKAKTERERAVIAEAVRSNANLRSLVHLKEEVVQKMCDAAEREEVPAGTEVVQRGEYGGMFYIIESGSFELRLDDGAAAQPQKLLRAETGCAAERLGSEMRKRMRRKESFLQELVHSKDLAGSPVAAVGRVEATPKRGNFWRCNSFVSTDAGDSHTPSTLRRSSTSTLGTEDGRSPNTPLHVHVDPCLQGAKPALVSPTGAALPGRCFERTPYPHLLKSQPHAISEDSPVGLAKEAGNDFKLPPPPRAAGPEEEAHCYHVLGVRRSGDSFGELALLYHAPRTSTAVAREDSVVWRVSQEAFRRIMLRKQEEKTARVVGHLSQVDILQGLLSQEREELAQNCLLQTFKQGDWIVHEGERQNVWYVLVQGECALFRGADGSKEELATLQPLQHFGERSLLRDAASEFSVKACSAEDVVCLALDGPTFKELAGLLHNHAAFRRATEDDLAEFAAYKGSRSRKGAGLLPRLKAAQASPTTSPGAEHDAPLKLDPMVGTRSLQRVGILGAGAFGVVSLEKDPVSGQMFALKTLSKGSIVKNNLVKDVVSEREILTMIDSPFCMRLYATHKDESYIYFLFEPLLGGDLHTRMHREPTVFSKPAVTSFIVGCMTLALEHLHERNIVFRDLKPENILLDTNGYCKLCDYGFAKFVLGRTMTLCGTPEYMAPEAIRHNGYNRMVDWWAIGVLTFELLCGETPFVDEDEDAGAQVIFCNILAGIEYIAIPFTWAAAVSFVTGLLQPSASSRLGIGGTQQVKEHQFFSGLDFAELELQKADAPYKPIVTPIGQRKAKPEDLKRYPAAVAYKDNGSNWDAVF